MTQTLSKDTLNKGYDWLKQAWNDGYQFAFQWGGLPINQTPEDIVRLQELICDYKPDMIIETGVWHGGSQLFYASICHMMGHGRVIGIEKTLKAETVQALGQHNLSNYITLIEGDSRRLGTLENLTIKDTEKVIVILDASHRRDDVLAELNNFAPLIPIGGYILVADTLLKECADQPNGKARWRDNNAYDAVQIFLENNIEFADMTPPQAITFFKGGWLKRMSHADG